MSSGVTALERAGFEPIRYPTYGRLAQGVFRGRNVHEGYQRGAGMEYVDVRQQVDAHPLFQEAFAAAHGRSLVSADRLRNLFLILSMHLGGLPAQNCIEFGSYKGGSLLFMGVVLRALYPEAKVYGLDTFSGMPASNPEVDGHGEGDFDDANLMDIFRAIVALDLRNVVLVQGLLEDTFHAEVPEAMTFGLAHIDLDIYPSIKFAQDAIWPRMVEGGYLVYDDATTSNCLGATMAVEELIVERGVRSEQIFPHFVFRTGLPG